MAQPKPLKDRLTVPLLEKLRTRKLTNAEVAGKLGVSETYLSRTVAALQDKVPGTTTKERAAKAKLAKARRQTRENYAVRVKNGELDTAAAATRAHCSERTMARYVAAYKPPRNRGAQKRA